MKNWKDAAVGGSNMAIYLWLLSGDNWEILPYETISKAVGAHEESSTPQGLNHCRGKGRYNHVGGVLGEL